MLNGFYKTNMTDFSQLIVRKFTPHLYNASIFGSCGCGPTALSLLTGDSPFDLQCQLSKSGDHTPDKVMVKVLKRKKFKVIPITKAEMTPSRYYISKGISNYNVVLISALFQKNEASWGVIYDQVFYHNFQISHMSALTLLNRPILTAYCLWHEQWGNYTPVYNET